MAKLTLDAPSYADADRALNGRYSVKIGHNTHLVRRDERTIGVRLHSTDIVTLSADGTATLDSGGWRSVTTKQRMNAILPPWVRVYQSAGEWFVWYRRTDTVMPYQDGMVVSID